MLEIFANVNSQKIYVLWLAKLNRLSVPLQHNIRLKTSATDVPLLHGNRQ